MKVYLLNPPFYPHFGRGMRWQDTGRVGTLYYPVWLAYAAAVIEQEHEARLVDAPAWGWGRDEVISDVRKSRPDLIIIDSSFPSLDNDLSVAKEIKCSYPGAKIVFVGPPASQFPNRILASQGVDFVARWEYDFTIRDLAERIEKDRGLGHIKGISYKDNGKVVQNPDREPTSSEDLDKIPFVSKVYKKYLNMEDYFLGNSLYQEVQIFTGRGCPFHCTFCSWPQTLSGRKYRVRSIANVLDELEWIQQNLPKVKEVFFEDDTFSIDRNRVLAFTEEYKRRGLTITWACNARVGLDYEVLKEMKQAHCRLLIVGYESGSDIILGNIKKGITVDEIRQFSRDTRKAGMLVNGDFIIGLPGETKETVDMTKRLIKEIKPDILQVSVASPFPGTEFYHWAKNSGYLLTNNLDEYLDKDGHQKAIISYPELAAEQMVAAVDDILMGYYLTPAYVPIALRQVLRRHGWDELARLWRLTRGFIRYISMRWTPKFRQLAKREFRS